MFLTFVDFLPKARELIKRFLSQSGKIERVGNIVRKMVASHGSLFANFGVPTNAIVIQFFNLP